MAERAENRVVVCGDALLDRGRGCVLRGGQPVHLRPQSFEVLDYLVRHRGRLVEKGELLDQVWRGRAVGDDSLVQCLRDIRRAIDDEGGRCLRTVRGRGYILEDLPPPAPPVARGVASEPGRERRLAWTARRALRWPAAVAAAALIVGIAAWSRWHEVPPAVPIRSIAVLPFVHDSEDARAAWLADGSTDSLINALAQLPGVGVKPRTAVDHQRAAAPQALGGTLGVQALVYGRLTQQGDDLALAISLVDTATGDQIWGHRYPTDLSGLPATQRRIAVDLVRRIAPDLADAAVLTEGYLPTADAYLLYLRGRHEQMKVTQPAVLEAIGFYEQAVAADPDFALAHASLADCWRALTIVGEVPSIQGFPAARAAAKRALELDPNLVEAHVALAWIAFSYDWDWAEGERRLQRAIALGPDNPDPHRAYAHLLSNSGRHGEALVEAQRAVALDPRTPITRVLDAQFVMYSGDLDAAEARVDELLMATPHFWPAITLQGRLHLARGDVAAALRSFEAAREASPQSVEVATQLGYALARAGRRSEARQLLAELQAARPPRFAPAYSLAMIQNGLGERAAALGELRRSVEQREVQATFIGIDRRWDPFRAAPEFIALLARMHLH